MSPSDVCKPNGTGTRIDAHGGAIGGGVTGEMGDGVDDGDGCGRRAERGTREQGTKPTLAFETYADDAYGYRLVHPAGWVVDGEPVGGASFSDPRGSAGATVSVDEGLDLTLGAYVAGFLEALAADEHVRALEDRWMGRVIDYAYLGAPDGERWRLTYLFVRAGERGYVLGIDWKDEEGFDDDAVRIAESFALERC